MVFVFITMGKCWCGSPRKSMGKKIENFERDGCNAIRTSHNPPAPEFLDLCDKMGFLLWMNRSMNGNMEKKIWISSIL